eukprot:gnl/MRDRNA2_/MRDRNA2_27896_c0_seq1.p1 gnl/MRDRNA2_/MRDRNA2_27896_c0~~gnl/MRDRNA2_/MRDRNA2_27896_c0_seq1.p1  ORF type:complete len:604 (+),score=131.84 gnl/MRDRNA2_/MRDRNA2_27896_c0_seq1:38-1813(+)
MSKACEKKVMKACAQTSISNVDAIKKTLMNLMALNTNVTNGVKKWHGRRFEVLKAIGKLPTELGMQLNEYMNEMLKGFQSKTTASWQVYIPGMLHVLGTPDDEIQDLCSLIGGKKRDKAVPLKFAMLPAKKVIVLFKKLFSSRYETKKNRLGIIRNAKAMTSKKRALQRVSSASKSTGSCSANGASQTSPCSSRYFLCEIGTFSTSFIRSREGSNMWKETFRKAQSLAPAEERPKLDKVRKLYSQANMKPCRDALWSVLYPDEPAPAQRVDVAGGMMERFKQEMHKIKDAGLQLGGSDAQKSSGKLLKKKSATSAQKSVVTKIKKGDSVPAPNQLHEGECNRDEKGRELTKKPGHSRFKGVTFHKAFGGRWQASAAGIHLGLHESEEAAADHRKRYLESQEGIAKQHSVWQETNGKKASSAVPVEEVGTTLATNVNTMEVAEEIKQMQLKDFWGPAASKSQEAQKATDHANQDHIVKPATKDSTGSSASHGTSEEVGNKEQQTISPVLDVIIVEDANGESSLSEPKERGEPPMPKRCRKATNGPGGDDMYLTNLQNLVDMGFDIDDAERALRDACGNVELASAILVSDAAS